MGAGKRKWVGSLFYDSLGRSRGRNVDSIPNRLAIRRTQPSSLRNIRDILRIQDGLIYRW